MEMRQETKEKCKYRILPFKCNSVNQRITVL